MELLRDEIEFLKEQEPEEYTDENFYIPSDSIRFFSYLSKNILSHTDIRDISDYVIQRPVYSRPFASGTIYTEKGFKSIVPELNNLRDEMMTIREITHLLNYLKNYSDMNSIYKNVVPTFNEYDYLKTINSFYSDYYRRLVHNNAIEAARTINSKNQKDNLSDIIAYLVLEQKKENYDIDKLNEISSNSKKIEKKLISKGYTY